MNLKRLLVISCVFSLAGCATQIQQAKMNDSRDQFKRGDLNNTISTIQSAFPNKNTLYFLEMGQTQRLLGPAQIPKSTQNLIVADQDVQRWEIRTNERLKRSLNDIGSYVLSEGLSNDYDLKPYEIGLLSQYLSLNHIAQGRWNDAMVEAKKMASREKVIEELIQKKIASISNAQSDQQNHPNTKGSTSSIESIGGYPVNLLDDYETRSLKNSYQNPSSYYLSAFIYESQGETSLAAPGYRLAIELRPSVDFFKSSLANLDKNIKNKQKSKDADTLFVIDTGYLPKITPLKINQSFNIGSGPKFITMTFPVIEQSSELFTPNFVEVAGQSIRPELTSSIDAMARKNLKDDMPAYVLRATSRALISLAAQLAADRAAQQRNNKNNNNNNALAGALAGLITAAALQAINVTDVRHWSTLPSQTYMARVNLPVGQNILKYSTPSGAIISQNINLNQGYNVIYLRIFRDRASVLTSNDPNALPVKADAIFAKDPSKINPESSGIATMVDGEKLGFFDRLKKFTGSQDDPKSSVKIPLAITEMPTDKPSNPIKGEDSDSAKGGFFGNLRKLITPREESMAMPLDTSKSTPPETSLAPAVNSMDNADKSNLVNQPNLFDSVKQLFDKKDSQ
jgi:hypothetical protein